MKKLILLLLIFSSYNTYACLNLPITNPMTNYYENTGLNSVHIPYGHTFKSDSFLLVQLKKINQDYVKNKNIDALITKGVLLILLKRYDEAIKLYIKLYKQIDYDNYSIASNLGTAYELIGDNKNAYKWMTRAIVADPSSHFNSEWIHINILNLKLNKNPIITSNALIEVDFGLLDKPITSISKDSLDELKRAIFFQLEERMSFIKPKDPIIAHLLFDLANINFLLNDSSSALQIYNLSKQYGFSNNLIEKRIKAISEPQKITNESKITNKPKPTSNNTPWYYSVYIGVGIVLLLLIIIIIRRGNS